MPRFKVFSATLACLAIAAASIDLHANGHGRALVVTMTNDPNANEIMVYDAESHALLQRLSTQGTGGVSGNARGVTQYDGRIVAAVNNGSGTVAMFRRHGDALRFDRVVQTTSAPVSADFGNDHLYVAGTNTVDVVVLQRGRVSGSAPTAVPAPNGALAPFGSAVYPDGTALITLAHSNQDGLFRDGAFASVIGAMQNAPCWMTRDGKYVFVANTGSRTISRLVGTGRNIFIDNPVAATTPTGAPADIDADAGVLGVIDHGAGESHLSLFTYDRFGELAAAGAIITIGVPAANGVAILAPRDAERN
jgi:hypothetical protein